MDRQLESDEFATWSDAETGMTVRYGLPLFGEIDFFCNESFRRIPHGGIENGGLLLGRVRDGVPQIEAFQAIECEHATGPSFQLSQRDVQRLQAQIAAVASDPELDGLEVLGWFISHSRSDLVMTGTERQMFADLFRGGGKLTVLVKPDKLKSTRFAFLIRRSDGLMPDDGTQRAIVLPLSSRPMAPAPEPVRPPVAMSQAPVEPPPAARTEPAPELPKPTVPKPAVPKPAVAEPAVTEPTVAEPAFTGPAPLPSPIVPEKPGPVFETPLPRFAQVRPAERSPGSGLFWGLLGAAAAFAGLAAWGVFLRSISSSIPMQISPKGSTLIVSWPNERTRDADYAALRVNNGEEAPLSDEEKAVATLPIRGNGGDYEVELIVRQWGRESHGYIRFLEAPAPGSAGSSQSGAAGRR